MRYDLLNAKDPTIDLAMLVYENWQKRNKVCTSKQLQFVVSTEIFNGNQALDLTKNYQPLSVQIFDSSKRNKIISRLFH